jgi:hypothetical protein
VLQNKVRQRKLVAEQVLQEKVRQRKLVAEQVLQKKVRQRKLVAEEVLQMRLPATLQMRLRVAKALLRMLLQKISLGLHSKTSP